MIDERPSPPPAWTQGSPDTRWRPGPDTRLRRFLGGSPAAVLAKLVLVSLVVGIVLMWLDIRPAQVFRTLVDLADRLWALGLDGLRDFGTYIVAGAALVLPVWLLTRILSYRAPR